jgi:hypothetical protein
MLLRGSEDDKQMLLQLLERASFKLENCELRVGAGVVGGAMVVADVVRLRRAGDGDPGLSVLAAEEAGPGGGLEAVVMQA